LIQQALIQAVSLTSGTNGIASPGPGIQSFAGKAVRMPGGRIVEKIGGQTENCLRVSGVRCRFCQMAGPVQRMRWLEQPVGGSPGCAAGRYAQWLCRRRSNTGQGAV